MFIHIKQAITITTIQSPTPSVLKFARYKDFTLFVSGDNITPQNWHLPNVQFISIQAQKKKYPVLSEIVSENHYARKNFAYLDALESGADSIFETDDDNTPNTFFPNSDHPEEVLDEIQGKTYINIYSFFTKHHVWPRGLPLNHIHDTGTIRKMTKPPEVLIQQSLADLDPDVDAIYRLTVGRSIRFQSQKMIAIAQGTFCPFNSQATHWQKKVFPLLYLPSSVNSRVTDIWRGYIAQRILWELDSRLIFRSPTVYQKRNPHDHMKDFRDEIDMYVKTETLVEILKEIKLKGHVPVMLTQIYKTLIAESFFNQNELLGLKAWLTYFE